jgi:ACS family D-galactonate transporter-like MFS transporter
VTWRPHHTLWGVLALGVLANNIFRRGLGPVLIPLRAEFGLSYAEVSLVAFVPILSYSLTQFPAGHLGDRVGPARVLVAGCLLWGTTTALAGGAGSFAALLGLLALAGMGEGTLFGNDRALVATHSPPGRQGIGQALTMAAAGVGTLVGVIGAGAVAEALGWRAAFLLFALPVFAYAAAVRRWIVPLPPRARRPGAGGPVGWRAFVTPPLVAMYGAGAAIAFTTWFLGTWGPDLFVDAGAGGPRRASLFAGLVGVAIMAGLPLAGLVSDRLGGGVARARFVVALLVAAGVLCVLLGVAIAGRAGIPVLVGLAMLISGLTWGAWSPLMVNVSAEAPPAHLGLAYGLTNSLCQSGSLAAPVVGGWLRDQTASFAGGSYAAAAILWLAAAGVLVVYRRTDR